MTDLETKIWDMVSNWAKEQIYPINDFALRALMDEILALVNGSSKEDEIKKLVEELKKKTVGYKNEADSLSWSNGFQRKQVCLNVVERNEFAINLLEKILKSMNDPIVKQLVETNSIPLRECTDCGSKFGGNERCPECFPMG